MVEKTFSNLKEHLNKRRTLVSSEQSLNGKLFVQIIALMFLSYIKMQMQITELMKDYTIGSLLDKLDVPECFEEPDRSLRVGEELEKQKDICTKLDIQ